MIEHTEGLAGSPAAPPEVRGFAVPGGPRTERGGRITADAFRLLTLRIKGGLKPTPAAAEAVADPVPAPVAPMVVVDTAPALDFPAIPDLPVDVEPPRFSLPTFEPLRPSGEDVEAATNAADLPDDFVEAAEMDDSAPAPPEPAQAAAEVAEEAFEPAPMSTDVDDSPTPPPAEHSVAVEPEPVAAELDFAAPATAGAEPGSPSKSEKPALAERVIEAMLKTVSEAVYATPTAAERAAFLREVAALDATTRAGEKAAEAVETVPQPEPPVVEPALEMPESPEPEAREIPPLPEVLAEKLGSSSPLLRRPADVADPFSKTVAEAIRLEAKPPETPDADADSGELALSLLDMMSAGTGSTLPQERALAADTLLRIVSRVPVKPLIAVVERVAIMEAPPSLLVAKLIRDPRPDVVAPLLERCMHITDQDLINAAAEGDSAKRRMIARRRILSPVLADHLIATGDPSVLLTLIRNPGAAFSHDAFYRLAEEAGRHPPLLAPLTTRADLPAPVAFELFWFAPTELRRFIFSRFLTDSETLNRILKITLATQDGGETRLPARELLEDVMDTAARGHIERAADMLADLAGVGRETAMRVLSDRDGEPIAVMLKALGYPRARLAGALERFKHSDCQLLRGERDVAELESIFDTLSFNKARILLTYWDWFVQKTGPYAPHN